MLGDVRHVREHVEDLAMRKAEGIGDALHILPSGERAQNRCDIDAGTSDARLPETDARIHRDTREDLHTLTFPEGALTRPSQPGL